MNAEHALPLMLQWDSSYDTKHDRFSELGLSMPLFCEQVDTLHIVRMTSTRPATINKTGEILHTSPEVTR